MTQEFKMLYRTRFHFEMNDGDIFSPPASREFSQNFKKGMQIIIRGHKATKDYDIYPGIKTEFEEYETHIGKITLIKRKKPRMDIYVKEIS